MQIADRALIQTRATPQVQIFLTRQIGAERRGQQQTQDHKQRFEHAQDATSSSSDFPDKDALDVSRHMGDPAAST